jgi:DNA polymerase III delta prime subunit
LRKAANHLQAAERALREGHDAQVFLNCKGAFESLPGAPQNIFENLESKEEREKLDRLMRDAGNFFHLGRHTADEGPRQGEFAVDHADASFALNLAKLLLAQTARVLGRPPRLPE